MRGVQQNVGIEGRHRFLKNFRKRTRRGVSRGGSKAASWVFKEFLRFQLSREHQEVFLRGFRAISEALLLEPLASESLEYFSGFRGFPERFQVSGDFSRSQGVLEHFKEFT